MTLGITSDVLVPPCAMRSLLDHAAPRFGRPRKIPLRSIAILLALHAIRTGSSMIISRIVSTADDLTPSERHMIGIPKGVALNDKRIRSGVTALIGRSAAGLQISHDHPRSRSRHRRGHRLRS